MKKVSAINVYLLLILSMFSSCRDNSTDPYDELTVKPLVIKTSTNYDADLFNATFPQADILSNISEAYKNNYSEDLKNKLIDYVTSELESMGEDETVFLDCFALTNCQNENSISLPTYVEKAEFNGIDAYLIQLTWGIEPSDLGHFKCFAIGADSKDILYYSQCR